VRVSNTDPEIRIRPRPAARTDERGVARVDVPAWTIVVVEVEKSNYGTQGMTLRLPVCDKSSEWERLGASDVQSDRSVEIRVSTAPITGP
jgi:hypothetical protein